MKKLILLFLAGSTVTAASAQERKSSVIFNRQDQVQNANMQPRIAKDGAAHNFAQKATAGPGGSRWYAYGDSVLGIKSSTTTTHFGGFNLWGDTTAVMGYTSSGTPTYYINNWTSMGLSLDPFFSIWNDYDVFGSQIKMTTSNSYVIDSVAIFGSYARSLDASKLDVVDTLRLGLVSGSGAGTSDLPTYYFTGMADYGVDTLRFIDMKHDSLNNVAQGTTLLKKDIYLTGTDSATNFLKIVPVTFNVPAGSYAAASVSFKTGDPNYVVTAGIGDTVQRADASYKYHDFSMDYIITGDATTVQYPTYMAADHTSGYWKREGAFDAGWGGFYIPNWAWSTASGASALQYPDIWFHVTCSTCAVMAPVSVKNVDLVSGIKAYPNPANGQLTIAYNVTENAKVNVTIINMLGQVVAAQTSTQKGSGQANFNTTSLPAGVYMYTVEANGSKTTGRVSVAH